jgi:hypothetical protein
MGAGMILSPCAWAVPAGYVSVVGLMVGCGGTITEAWRVTSGSE